MRTLVRWALAPLVVMTLSACGGESDKAENGPAAEATSRSLAATVNEGDFDTLGGVLTNAGLTSVLEGNGPYTVFAPADAAFMAGAASEDLTNEAMKAQAAALLRAHIVPGALTRADIEAAVQGGGASGAQMRTMADTLLTFTREGAAIVITAPDGAQARLTGQETVANNGVLQPVDALLVKANTPAATAAPTG